MELKHSQHGRVKISFKSTLTYDEKEIIWLLDGADLNKEMYAHSRQKRHSVFNPAQNRRIFNFAHDKTPNTFV